MFKTMKLKSKATLIILSLAALALIGFLVFRSQSTDDLPGSVIGPNPENIPESKLPVCNMTSFGFDEQPCYSPPGSLYL